MIRVDAGVQGWPVAACDNYTGIAALAQASVTNPASNLVVPQVRVTKSVLTTNVASDGALHFDIDGTVLTVNNTTHAFGKLEGNLNVNSAAFALLANNFTPPFTPARTMAAFALIRPSDEFKVETPGCA